MRGPVSLARLPPIHVALAAAGFHDERMKPWLGAAFAVFIGLTFADGCSSSKSPCSIVLASDYDQSCTVDTDCVSVGQVPVCPALACYADCTMWTISKSAAAQYMTALSRASASVAGESCGCANYNPYPCCRGGTCTTTCDSPTDAGAE